MTGEYNTCNERPLLTVFRDPVRAGDFGIEVIGEALNTTPRTLQRRLKEQATSHRELVEEMRKAMAAY